MNKNKWFWNNRRTSIEGLDEEYRELGEFGLVASED